PLAEPFTLGVSSGATLGAAIAIFISDYFLKYRFPIFPFAFIGGCSTLLILSIVLLKRNVSLFTLIFIGISLSYFFNAFLTLLLSMLGNRSYEVLLWMFGSFSNPPRIPVLLLYFLGFLAVFIILYLSNRKLDILYLSDELAESSGININFERNLYLALTSAITIVTVSLCGVIGFVGLIIPHLSRLLFGSKHRDLLVSSALLGAILLLVSDDLARSLLSVALDYGKEIPIGVITSLLGAPFFIYFLIKNRTVV
nr:iron ABC transporter permease [Spirochaetota bacterium]